MANFNYRVIAKTDEQILAIVKMTNKGGMKATNCYHYNDTGATFEIESLFTDLTEKLTEIVGKDGFSQISVYGQH